MNKVYDNGALMLGNIKMVIEKIEKEIEENLDMCFVDQNELLKDLKELATDDENMVVCINYDNGMGYSLDYWYERDIVNNKEEYKRTCSECGKEMTQGYCIENGMEYYCSDECLHKHYTDEEWKELYDDGNGDSYWTEWECE